MQLSVRTACALPIYHASSKAYRHEKPLYGVPKALQRPLSPLSIPHIYYKSVNARGVSCRRAIPPTILPAPYGRRSGAPGNVQGESGTLRFIDRTLCEGTIGDMIGDAIRAIAKNLKRQSVIVGIGRVDRLEIPEEVLREAVANALIHRDYNPRFDGQAVNVDIFDDRIEIINPGGLYGSARRQTLASGVSSCRNAALMRLMSLVPLPPEAGSPTEGNGSGIPMMIQACHERGLKEPTFCPGLDQFKVILHRPGASMNPKIEGVDNVDQKPIPGTRRISTKLGEQYIKDCLIEYGELSTQQLQDLTGMNVNQVRNRIRNLIDMGEVLPTASASSRNRKYKIAG